MKGGYCSSKFSLLSCPTCTLLVLPHSSASVERISSQVNCVKTNRTNVLNVETTKKMENCTVHGRYEKQRLEENQ